MYPYLRLMDVAFRNILRKEYVSINQETVIQFRVLPSDIDTNLHLNNGRYLTLMDLARFDFIGKVGLLKPLIKKRWFPVLGAAQMIYLKSLRCFQSYTVHTALECWDDKWFMMTQRFESQGKVYAYGHVRGMIRNRNGNIAPEKVLQTAGLDNIQSPPPSATTRLWLETLQSYRNNSEPRATASGQP
jgi:acyl-CoA thioesterase FadM